MKKSTLLLLLFIGTFHFSSYSQDISTYFNQIGDYIIQNIIPEKFEVNEKYLGDVKMAFQNGYNVNSDVNLGSVFRFNMNTDSGRKDFKVYLKLLGDGKFNIDYRSFADVFKTKGDVDFEMELDTGEIIGRVFDWYEEGSNWASDALDSWWGESETEEQKKQKKINDNLSKGRNGIIIN